MEFLNQEFTPINGETYKVSDHFSKEDFVIKEKDSFVRHNPLLRVAKALLGVKERKVDVMSTPEKSNSWSSTVKVTYVFNDGFVFESSAEARLENLDKNMAIYSVTMAETRASARALRFALGVDFCSIEEIASGAGNLFDNSPAESGQIGAIKSFVSKGIVTLDQVLSKYKVNSLEEMTREQAAGAISALNKKRNKK